MLQNIVQDILNSEITVTDESIKVTYDKKDLYVIEKHSSEYLLIWDSNARLIATIDSTGASFEVLSELTLDEFNIKVTSSFAGAIPTDYRWDNALLEIFKGLNLFEDEEKSKILYQLKTNTFANRFVSLQNLGTFINDEIDEKDLELLKQNPEFKRALKDIKTENDAKLNADKTIIDYGFILFGKDKDLFNKILVKKPLIIIEFILLILKRAYNKDISNLICIKFIKIFEMYNKFGKEQKEELERLQNDINEMQNKNTSAEIEGSIIEDKESN